MSTPTTIPENFQPNQTALAAYMIMEAIMENTVKDIKTKKENILCTIALMSEGECEDDLRKLLA
jgi:hypothetical protein